MDLAIGGKSVRGPDFYGIGISNDNDVGNWSGDFGFSYNSDTRLDGTTFFPGSRTFKVKEIEVFETTK
jgi:hypothetical protein